MENCRENAVFDGKKIVDVGLGYLHTLVLAQ